MRDSGAQPERTRLAWRGTVLTATVVAVCVRQAFAAGPTDAALVTAGVGRPGWGCASAPSCAVARVRPGAMRPPWPALAAAVVLTLAALGTLTLFKPEPPRLALVG